MGLLDKIFKKEQEGAAQQTRPERKITEFNLAATSRVVKEDFSGQEYSFLLNDAFKWAKSHAGEVEMLYTYAPDAEFGEEGAIPYIAIQEDDAVFCAIDEFKENGTFEEALELTALSGKFLFKAKREYYGDIMYFYGFVRDEGFWEQAGLCLVYPRELLGTESEKRLMGVLDKAADSFTEA